MWQKVSVLWKTSCLVPLPNKSSPSALNDYGPVALTSHIMKVLVELVSGLRWPPFLTHCSFPTAPRLDAIIYLLQRAHSHLDKAGSTVRIVFFDFSSAFNTIRPLLPGGKPQKRQVDTSTISWIMDIYLTTFLPGGKIVSIFFVYIRIYLYLLIVCFLPTSVSASCVSYVCFGAFVQCV